MNGSVHVRSPAKINWNLRVIARRGDGFHEIESLVSPVTLYDELVFSGRADSSFELLCEHPAIPRDDRNLVARAARLLAGRSGTASGVTCVLTKRIPMGGGLGGGSSNAAATLLALNQLWSLDWPMERLLPLAAELGSDVPLFMERGSAIIRGRGEQVERVTVGWSGWIVLLLPDFAVSTAEVYRAWQPECVTANPHPPWPVSHLGAAALMQQSFNMLEAPALRIVPALEDLLAGAASLAGRPVRMSGSGSSLFTAFDRRSEAERFAQRIRESQPRLATCLVQLVDGA